MNIIINPGSGPVEGATEDQARSNLRVFLSDAGVDGATYSLGKNCGDGRFAYRISNGKRVVEIEMPGIELEKVRWMGEESGNIWDFPRLYIDGSSWIWLFALNIFTAAGEEDEDDE